MTIREEVENYAKDVIAGNIISGRPVLLACKRYFADIKDQQKKGFYLDEVAGTTFIKFIEMLPHVKGQPANEGRLLKLEPVQKFIIFNLFAWKWSSTKKRRFRHAYIEMAKKNAKSTLAAAIALAMFVLDGEAGAEIYAAATTSDQAQEVFDKTAVRMWQKSAWLQKDNKGQDRITKSQYRLNFLKYGSYFKSLPGDSDSAEGKNAHCAIVDEYHVHKTDHLVNNLVSGSITRTQPLIIRITTAGVSRKVPCYTYRMDCIKVLEKITHDETLFIMIFALDEKDYEGDGWKNPKNWGKAHPLWDSNSELRAGVEAEFQAAVRSTTKEIDFKTKMLNIWTDTAKTWIPDSKYIKSYGGLDITKPKDYKKILERMDKRVCFGGLDLSKKQDFSAFTLVFPNDDGSFDTLYYYWLPKDRALERSSSHAQNIIEWGNKGFVKLTEGDVIDHQEIRNDINGLNEMYLIDSIAYDSAFSVTLVTELMQDGLTLNPFSQGYNSMGAPTSEMEKLILTKQLNHFNNPVQRWMMSNVLIVPNANGNIKIDKNKSMESVDGPVSTVMAIGQYLIINGEEKQSYAVA